MVTDAIDDLDGLFNTMMDLLHQTRPEWDKSTANPGKWAKERLGKWQFNDEEPDEVLKHVQSCIVTSWAALSKAGWTAHRVQDGAYPSFPTGVLAVILRRPQRDPDAPLYPLCDGGWYFYACVEALRSALWSFDLTLVDRGPPSDDSRVEHLNNEREVVLSSVIGRKGAPLGHFVDFVSSILIGDAMGQPHFGHSERRVLGLITTGPPEPAPFSDDEGSDQANANDDEPGEFEETAGALSMMVLDVLNNVSEDLRREFLVLRDFEIVKSRHHTSIDGPARSINHWSLTGMNLFRMLLFLGEYSRAADLLEVFGPEAAGDPTKKAGAMHMFDAAATSITERTGMNLLHLVAQRPPRNSQCQGARRVMRFIEKMPHSRGMLTEGAQVRFFNESRKGTVDEQRCREVTPAAMVGSFICGGLYNPDFEAQVFHTELIINAFSMLNIVGNPLAPRPEGSSFSGTADVYECTPFDCDLPAAGEEPVYQRSTIAHNSLPFDFLPGGAIPESEEALESEVVYQVPGAVIMSMELGVPVPMSRAAYNRFSKDLCSSNSPYPSDDVIAFCLDGPRKGDATLGQFDWEKIAACNHKITEEELRESAWTFTCGATEVPRSVPDSPWFGSCPESKGAALRCLHFAPFAPMPEGWTVQLTRTAQVGGHWGDGTSEDDEGDPSFAEWHIEYIDPNGKPHRDHTILVALAETLREHKEFKELKKLVAKEQPSHHDDDDKESSQDSEEGAEWLKDGDPMPALRLDWWQGEQRSIAPDIACSKCGFPALANRENHWFQEDGTGPACFNSTKQTRHTWRYFSDYAPIEDFEEVLSVVAVVGSLRMILALGFRAGTPGMLNYDILREIASFLLEDDGAYLHLWQLFEEGKKLRVVTLDEDNDGRIPDDVRSLLYRQR